MAQNKYRLAVIGGDARQLIAASRLTAEGYDVALYGFGGETSASTPSAVDSLCCSGCNAAVHELLANAADGTVSDCGTVCATAEEAICGSRAVILPLPASGDNNRVSMPLGANETLTLTGIVGMMAKNGVKLVCGGKLSRGFAELCTARGIEVFDYYEREEFAVANAIPTAEGAIEIAMRELPTTLDGSSALVIGYGRIGKVLSRLLSRLGTDVTASARKPADLAWIRADGHRAARTGELVSLLDANHFDMVFNTVPHTVLGEAELTKLSCGTLIVDLASKPGGVDITAADRLGRNIIWALSLPGKVAPVTSGRIIADTILGCLEKHGEEW